MRYLFILNPISGFRKNPFEIIDIVDSIFFNTNHEYEFSFTTHPGDALNIAKKAVKDKFNIIVAAGGDGTINEVASGLVKSDSALGIIPLGSGNGIARSYHIPLSIKESIEFLVNPKIVKVDVGEVNDHYFLGVCGMGYDAIVGKKFQEFGTRGPLPYFLIGVREFIRYEPEKLILKFNDKTITVSPLLITISNTEQYGNGAIISPGASPLDGILEICIINPMSILRAVNSSFKLFNKKINEIPEYSLYKTNALKIISGKQGVYHTDGEPHDRSIETNIRVLQGMLNACTRLT
jgi:YegS/Rv2252/BmrU family lipid kinase